MDAICKEQVVAIRTVYSVCRSFDILLQRTLGPNGKSSLLSTPTGQVLISNVGCSVLRCINVGHPLGTMIIDSIAAHHCYTGDGSKTFVLYLASILGSIANSAEDSLSTHNSEERISLLYAVHYIRSHVLNNVLWPVVSRNCQVTGVCENRNVMTVMHNLVKSHLCGKYTEAIRSHLSRLLVDFLCAGLTDFRSLSAEINTCIDNFSLLCIDVDCMTPLSSYIYEGIVIQRDFLNSCHSPADSCCTRFILLHSSFTKDGGRSAISPVFKAKDIASIEGAFLWKHQCSTALVDWMQVNDVNLILSTGCIDDTLHTLCSNAGILMVQFVDKEDFERLEMLFHIAAIQFISDLSEVKSDVFIGCSEVCEAKIFGQKRYVCLKLCDQNQKYTNMQKSCSETSCDDQTARKCHRGCLKRQLIVCGMSAGACQQIRMDLLYALKTLRLWLDSKWPDDEASQCTAVHIAAGGSFELTCYNALRDFMKQNQMQLGVHKTVCCEALCAALLSVPLRLLHNSFQPKLATVLYVEERIKSLQASGATICGFDGRSGRQLEVDTTTVEPLMSKVLLLDHVLQLTMQLLRITSLLHVKKPLQKSVARS